MKTKALLLLLLVVTTVADTTPPEEVARVGGRRRILTAEKIAGEDVEADVNNHHSIPRESWGNDDNNP
ncbi:hypothetical protein AALP_AA8G027000 [Arabis alpina]|uniref:Uncharacterized protein n=1 Tax=Arabis alpina TaxID=50452 RepID=A0A087G4K1_ARAAL|nr:hypothetical protein AALP_AA8G027000 [Arabis alpina]